MSRIHRIDHQMNKKQKYSELKALSFNNDVIKDSLSKNPLPSAAPP